MLAQTRQAARDKAHADADARHRENLAMALEERQMIMSKQAEQLMALLQQNTQLTEMVKVLSQRIEELTLDMHAKVVRNKHRGPGVSQASSPVADGAVGPEEAVPCTPGRPDRPR